MQPRAIKDDMEERTALETQTPADAKSWRAWHRDWLLLFTIAAVFAVDQLTKFIIKSNMRIGESWPAEGLVRLTHGTNTGTAFGLFPDQTLFLIFASLIAIGFLVYFYRAYALPKPILRFAIGLQLGGAFGNLLDRLRLGAVTDFIAVGPWPVFNLADASIVTGLLLLAWVLLRAGGQSDKTPTPAAAETAADPVAPNNPPDKDPPR